MLRGNKTKQISITKSADKEKLRGSLMATLASGQTFPFRKRVIPKLPKFANIHPQRGTATPLQQHLASALLKSSSSFSSCPNCPGFTLTHGQSISPLEHKLPQTGTEGAPSCFPYALQKHVMGRGFLLMPGRGRGSHQAGQERRLSMGNFNRQRQQYHFGEISSVYEM